jgi:hypothetical protein
MGGTATGEAAPGSISRSGPNGLVNTTDPSAPTATSNVPWLG